MQSTFWNRLSRPILGLSPMDGVTDHPFRFIQKKYGQPALVYTEFTSVEGVCHGADRLLEDFLYDETQRPIIAQIYGTTPDFFRQTATILCELGYDGIDINMGCPAKNVAHSGAGAALILTPSLAQEIIQATKAGVADWQNGKSARDCSDITDAIWREVERRHALLPRTYRSRSRIVPVSVKTRIGYDLSVVDSWIPTLLQESPAAIALHGRTLKQHYSGLADWEEIAKAAEIAHQVGTPLLGNGDVSSLATAHAHCKTYGVDGVLIGRGSMGNPFVFREDRQALTSQVQHELFTLALEHCRLFEETFSGKHNYSFLPMRKHLGWYVKSIPFATEIRAKLFRANSSAEVEAIFQEYSLLDEVV